MVSWVSTVAATGLIWLDTLLLGVFLDSEQVGLYNVATRLVTLAIFVLAPINATFGPHIAHLYHLQQEHDLRRVYQAASGWIVRLSMPAFVLLVVAPEPLLQVFGGEFRVAAAVTVILAAGQLVNAATGPCGTLLNMSGKVGVNMADNLAALILNLLLNLWLIPREGIVGAAIAWSASLAIVNIIRVVQVRILVGVSPFTVDTIKALAAGVAAGLVALLVKPLLPSSLALLVSATTVAVVYLCGIIALGVSPDDRLALTSLLRRRQPARHAARRPSVAGAKQSE
jgi:O-antigen/teichoic acid export membrane protein